jgi:nitroreductase
VIETIKTGRSVRKFKPDPVEDKKLKEVLKLPDEPFTG